jgi:DNA helicase HerA-like ATPase
MATPTSDIPTPATAPEIKILTRDRVFITGQTGTGKSYLASLFLSKLNRLIAIDTIGDLSEQFPRMEPYTKNGLARLKNGRAERMIIERPALDESDIPDWFEGIAAQALEIGDVTLYVDEAYNVIPNRMLRKYAMMLFTQGRHYGVGTWVSAQRPAKIQTESATEAQHYFIFRLNNPDDQMKIRKTIGWYEYPPDDHGFIYYHIGDPPIYFPYAKGKGDPIPVDQGNPTQDIKPAP